MLRFLLFFLITAAHSAHAGDIKVIDGDSIIVNDKMTRLVGIDAPEYFQVCYTKQDEPYFCGQEAKSYLENMIKEGRKHGKEVNCKKQGTDRYKRDLSVCRIGKKNLNKAMVSEGWAIAYRHNRYEKAQKEAQNQKKGIWQGRFMRPELHRILQKYEKTQK